MYLMLLLCAYKATAKAAELILFQIFLTFKTRIEALKVFLSDCLNQPLDLAKLSTFVKSVDVLNPVCEPPIFRA